MADQDDRFFGSKTPDDDDAPPRKEPPPKSRAVIIGVIALIAVAISAYVVTRKTEAAALWVVNPGPGPVTIDIGGEPQVVEKGKVLDIAVPIQAPFEIGVKRGETASTIKVDLGDHNKQVTLVDLGGDASYAVVDVSSYYGDKGLDEALTTQHVSPPAQVHVLPFAAPKLVRPGRALPEKGAWELNAFKRPNAEVEMLKVFRVDPKRLEDKDKLMGIFKEAITSANASQYENMQIVARTSTVPRKSIFDGAED